MILACQDICKAFVTGDVLIDVSFHIEEKEKAAIVGVNGAGKTTLLKILMGELPCDSGSVYIAKNTEIGYLSQHQTVLEENTIYEELLRVKQDVLELEREMRAAEEAMRHASGQELSRLMERYSAVSQEFERRDGYACRSEITGVLRGLGFSEEDFSRRTSDLSGGQKTRVALGRLLLSKPNLLILDEPTNHLDMDSIAWLENYLLGYPGAVLIVAHDRYFLDRTVTKIIELENCRARVYSGNYSAYAEKKAQLRAAQLAAYLNQQREIQHQEAVIEKLRSFNREKSIKRAESREKMLAKIDRLERPAEVHDQMSLAFEPETLSGNDVLTVTGLSKSYPSLPLFEDLHFEIKRGEKVAIIGNNGTGKTTLLKILNGLVQPDSGSFRFGAGVEIAYYDQEHQVLHMEKTLFQEISDTYPNLNNTKIRSVLAAFLFTGDDVFKRIQDLSGGERGRVSLAKLMLSQANFLILDEPTNHLDMVSKELLENALNHYTGTVLYVSHDRYFINRTASRILELTGNTLLNYIGNYDYYLEKKDALRSLYLPAQDVSADTGRGDASSKQDWQQRKEQQARLRKISSSLKRTEEEIAQLEQRDKEIDQLLTQEDVYTDVARCAALSKEKEELSDALLALMEKWEELESALSQEQEGQPS